MWFFLALLSGFLFATNRLLVRATLTKQINPMLFGAAHEILAGLLLLPLGLFYFSLPHSVHTWIALFVGMFFIFLCDLLAFLALEKIEASVYQIIGQLRHVIVLFSAYFLLTEAITVTKIVSIILIILGVYAALIVKSHITITKGTLYAFLSTVFISFAFLAIKIVTVDVSPAFSGALSLLFSGFAISTILLTKRTKPTKMIAIIRNKQLLLAAGIFALFEFSLFTALEIGQASKVTPVNQSSLVFTLLGGYLFLNERDLLKQKIFGSALIAIGIALLYFIQ